MNEREKMINGEIYEPFCQELEQDRFRAKELCREYIVVFSKFLNNLTRYFFTP